MGFDACNNCGHVFTKEGNDIPHADGGFMEINHGGGVCRSCYLLDERWECECGSLAYDTMKFCHQCGKPNPNGGG